MPLAPVNGTEIYYERAGQGEPVVLIPPMGFDHRYYDYALPYLAQSVKVIALDLRGTGQSAKPVGPYSVEEWAQDVSALLDVLGEPQAHIVGSSLGGCVALELADQHSEQVKSLVVVASFSEANRAMVANFRTRIAIVRQKGLGEILRDPVALWGLDRRFVETEQGKEALTSVVTSVGSNTSELYAEFCTALLRFGRGLPEQQGEPTFTQRLPHITHPTLVAVGDRDIVMPVAFSKQIVDLMPNAEFVVLKDSGHLAFIEHPEENARPIVDFVQKIATRTVHSTNRRKTNED